MLMFFPFALQLLRQLDLKNSDSSTVLREIIAIQNQFFQFLLREPITLSLRYFYSPHTIVSERSLQIFLFFNTQIQDLLEQEQLRRRINSALEVSKFYQVYLFEPVDLSDDKFYNLRNLDWVNAFIELQKAETITEEGYYFPHPFPPNKEHSMVDLCERFAQINRNSSPRKFLLEITLQSYNNPIEMAQWTNALDTVLKTQIKGTGSSLESVIKGFQYYQSRYNHTPLFTYSLKLLAESDHNLSFLTSAWLQNATDYEYLNRYRHFSIVKRDDPTFQQSLESICKIQIPPQTSYISSNLKNWQQQFGEQLICQVFRSPSGGNGSTRRVPTYTPPPQPPTQSRSPDQLSSSSASNLVKMSNYAITQWQGGQQQKSEPAKMQDLLPLRYLTTLDEISSFLRVIISNEDSEMPKLTAEEIFHLHQNLITKDQYIVGVNKQGQVVRSNWNDAPHRLVAGVTRCGKTNFLHWLIFQFLYADPERKIYILDLKQNNFRFYETQLPQKISDRVIVATEILECRKVLEEVNAEYQRRQKIIGDYQTIQEMVENGEEYVPRLLVLVDEAAMIPPKCEEIKSKILPSERHKYPDLNKLKDQIDTYLQYIATTGAGFSIHLMYCTQNPKTDVITTQVTSQLEERLIFRITDDTSPGVIGEHLYRFGSKIPKGEKGKGVAYIDGVEESEYVYTPLISMPPVTPFDRTLWRLL